MNEPQNPPWTPGPWYVDADYPCNVSTADHRTIAETCDSWFNLEISRANARLIAAAPELVAALEDTVSWCPMCAGTGRYSPYCVRCEDSTDDHFCPPSKPCFQCRDAKSLLARVRGEEKQG